MKLIVSEEKKKAAVKKVVVNTKKWKIMNIISKLILPATIIICFIHGFQEYVEPTKHIFSTISSIFFMAIFGCLMYFAFRILISTFASRNIVERVKEELAIEDDGIEYSFYMRYFTVPSKKIVVQIPFKGIENIKTENKTGRLTFEGKMFSFYDENKKISEKSDLPQIIIYDYFEPSLVCTLRDIGIQI